MAELISNERVDDIPFAVEPNANPRVKRASR